MLGKASHNWKIDPNGTLIRASQRLSQRVYPNGALQLWLLCALIRLVTADLDDTFEGLLIRKEAG